jgi:tetrahydromethanopterin S-methyltransferase subunit G
MTNEEKMQARLEELQRKVKKGAKETKEPVGKKIDSAKGANDIIQGAMATLGLAGFGQGADSDDDL